MWYGRTMSDPTRQVRLRRWARACLAAVAALFVGLVAWDLFSRFDQHAVSLDPTLLVLALLPASCAMLCQLAAFRALIARFTGKPMPLLPSAVLYLDSQMARYVPGKVGLAAVRLAGAARVGVPARVLASTLLIEVASWAASGLVLGLGLLAGLSTADRNLLPARLDDSVLSFVQLGSWLGAAGALLGTLFLCTVSRRRWPRALLGLMLGQSGEGIVEGEPLAEQDRPLAPFGLPLWHLAHACCWVATGACLALAVGAGLSEALAAGASLCIAIVLGFLAIVAPAGAGVREAALVALATPALGASAALSVGLLARAVALLSEVLLWLLARGLARRSRSLSI